MQYVGCVWCVEWYVCHYDDVLVWLGEVVLEGEVAGVADHVVEVVGILGDDVVDVSE